MPDVPNPCPPCASTLVLMDYPFMIGAGGDLLTTLLISFIGNGDEDSRRHLRSQRLFTWGWCVAGGACTGFVKFFSAVWAAMEEEGGSGECYSSRSSSRSTESSCCIMFCESHDKFMTGGRGQCISCRAIRCPDNVQHQFQSKGLTPSTGASHSPWSWKKTHGNNKQKCL